MKICLLTRQFDLDSGGIGHVSSELRNRLRKLGHKVCTVSTHELDLVNYFKYTFLDIRTQIPKDCDIYHAVTPMETIWIPKDKGIATILDIILITHPKLYGARMAGNKVKYTIGRAYFTIGCKQAAKCRYVTCISEHVKQEFIEHFNVDEKKVKVIKLGIRDDLIPMSKKDKIFRIGYLGQLDRRKRINLLVTSFMKSKTEGELILGGKGIDEQGLRELAKDDPRVKFLGFVPDNELADFYNSLDVFVFPTAIEGYGLPPIEAMACKKPVIVLEDSIMPLEVKKRCAIVEDLGMVFDLSCLENICKSVDIEDNYRWAKSHNWDKCIEEHIKLYREIVNS